MNEVEHLHCRLILPLLIQKPSKAITTIRSEPMALAKLVHENRVGFFEVFERLYQVFLADTHVSEGIEGVSKPA